MRIQAFKKEFRTRLSMMLGSNDEAQPKEHVLDFNHCAILMHEMGFLQSKVTTEQEQLMDDIYTVLKVKKQQNILSENL